MNRLSTASALLLLIAPIAAAAADDPARPTGAAILHLSEHADRIVPQDEIVALLHVDATAKAPLEAEAEVNRRMAAALEEAKKSPSIRFGAPATNLGANRGSSYVESSASSGSAASWTATQSIELRSKELAPMLTLMGKLEEQKLAITSLAFTVSHEALAAVQDPLTAEALKRLRARAEAVSAELGMAVDHLEGLVVGDAAPAGTPQPILFGGPYASETTPAPDAGQAPVSVVVTAEVVLRPKR
jgi:predicted secreted protein